MTVYIWNVCSVVYGSYSAYSSFIHALQREIRIVMTKGMKTRTDYVRMGAGFLESSNLSCVLYSYFFAGMSCFSGVVVDSFQGITSLSRAMVHRCSSYPVLVHARSLLLV